MPPILPTARTLVDALRRKKILTLEELCEAGRCSPMTVWRHLKPLGYLTSFNHNARYYTLAETPRFDADGVWFHRDVGFSSRGTLTETLVALVHHSKGGRTPGELSEVLHVRVQNQLYGLFVTGKVSRVQWGRTQLYLSVEEGVEQRRRREASQDRRAAEAGRRGAGRLTESETIAILAELARTPRSSARRVSIVLGGRGVEVTRDDVLGVIERYELRKKGRSRRSRR